MLIDSKDLINLPVVTQSNQPLGKVAGLVLDADSQSIYQYRVKPSGLGGFFSHELLIHRDQVVAVTADKMIVEDLVYTKLAAQIRGTDQPPRPAEAITSE